MSSNNKKVAIVTGSYRGIGLEIVKGLCKKFDGDVYITARSVEKAKETAEKLEKIGMNALYHQLDIENIESINALAQFIKDNYGGLDILVNNAAIAIDETKSPKEKASVEVIRVNFTATINVCDALFPLLRSNSRVVHVSSRMGLLTWINNSKLREKFLQQKTIEEVASLMNDYLISVKNNTWKKEGYPTKSYSVSKIGVNLITPMQQRNIEKDLTRTGIVISAMCPGYCKTDMTNNKGFLTAEQGAETAVYLALLPEDFSGPRGALWGENQPLNMDGYLIYQSLPMLRKFLASKFIKQKN